MKNYLKPVTFAAAVVVFALTLLTWQSSSPAASAQKQVNTFEIIHFAETQGRITNTPNAFDTTIYAHYVGSSRLTLELYLYDERTGLPLSGPQGKCEPCPPIIFTPGANSRRAIHLEDFIDFSTGRAVLGTAQLVIRDDDPSKLLTDVFLVNSRTNAFDLSFELLPLHPVPPVVGRR